MPLRAYTGSVARSDARQFRSRTEWRKWLAANHGRVAGLHLRLFKVHAAERGITYAEALDEALCFGWIDGVRRALDADSFTQRFTPRKPKSNWSRVNVRHVERLKAEGRMAAPGLAAFGKRDDARTGVYSFEQRPQNLPPALAKEFRKSPQAWSFFSAQPPGYRRLLAFWVTSAKKEQTRAARLARLIAASAAGKRLQ